MKKLRILIADDHGLVRRGTRGVLQSQPGVRVVGEATSGREAIEKAKKLKPDVAIIDISLPDLDGVEVTRQILGELPSTKVLVVTMHESEHMVKHALDAGARGYILKSDLTRFLPKAVKAVSEGKRFLTPKVSEIVLEGFLNKRRQYHQRGQDGVRPTPREMQVIRLLAEGKANKEIATQLGITVRTAQTHRSRIMLKLGLHSLAELIHYAMRNEIISAKPG